MSEYTFGTLGKKKIVFDGEKLTIKKTALSIDEIKCVYVKQPTMMQNGTVYFSTDGNDINTAAIDRNAFMFTQKQANGVNKLLDELDIEVLESFGASKKIIIPKTETLESDEHLIPPGQAIKICLNCGDILLEKAQKCPHCGKKAKDFPLVDKNNDEKINEVKASVSNPKSGRGKWQEDAEKKQGFWAKLNEQADEMNRAKNEEKQRQKDRIAQMDRDGIAYCSKCYSTSLTAHKKGFGIGKAIIGGMVFLPLAAAGNIGAKKVRVTCMKCGHQFWAGKK